MKEEGSDNVSQRGYITPGEHGSWNKLTRDHRGSQRLKWQLLNLHIYALRLLHMLWLLDWVSFYVIPSNGRRCISDSFDCS